MTTPDAELLAAALTPTAAWLESCFGPGALWRPETLPERLKDRGTREFLAGVGLPAVEVDLVDYDATGLPERGMWEADLDELFGNRTPDDDTPPSTWGYCVGTFGELHMMVDAESGTVQIYDPNGWDHASGHRGEAAGSLPGLIGALALLARFDGRIRNGEAKSALDEFVALLEELGQGPEDSELWSDVVESLREEYEDLDED
ncbi:hypothetical protein ACFV0O_28050 [Kitasatospora sp. NPDC059577]|uniref:hypothetical protein n=1 Tax=unclassified Kitasatospora TaxID=2633591 RepID=UPI0036AC9FA8